MEAQGNEPQAPGAWFAELLTLLHTLPWWAISLIASAALFVFVWCPIGAFAARRGFKASWKQGWGVTKNALFVYPAIYLLQAVASDEAPDPRRFLFVNFFAFLAVILGIAAGATWQTRKSGRPSFTVTAKVYNERVKLRAAWCNNISNTMMAVGVATPAASYILGVGSQQAHPSVAMLVTFIVLSLMLSFMMHRRAVSLLGKMKEEPSE